MATLFISDLHLHQSREDITHKFLQFCNEYAATADAVYILGDFFESWIGDDIVDDYQQTIIEQLQRISQHTPLYFMHGNRDFLLGKRFMQACQATLLSEPHVLELYGKRFILMHGDTLCLDDVSYQRYRSIARNRIIQTLFLSLPARYRQKLAGQVRTVSHNKNTAICDISPTEIPKLLNRYHADVLIHGHTHRPAIKQILLDKREATHIVLSDWGEKGNLLAVTPALDFELTYF